MRAALLLRARTLRGMAVRWIGIAGAIVFVAAGVWGMTSRERRRTVAIGYPSWLPFVLIAVGVLYAWGAWIRSLVPMMVGVVVVVGLERIVARRDRGRELPPRLAAMRELNERPLLMVLYPITWSKKAFAAFRNPLRGRRETNEWYEQRGL